MHTLAGFSPVRDYLKLCLKNTSLGTSLIDQWLKLYTSNAEDMGSILAQETKSPIPHVAGPKNEQRQKSNEKEREVPPKRKDIERKLRSIVIRPCESSSKKISTLNT